MPSDTHKQVLGDAPSPTQGHAGSVQPQARHTPGPWFVDSTDPSEVFGADGFSVAECGGVHIVLNPDGTKHPSEPGQSIERSWPEECANAGLIAAAPELLEALKAMVGGHTVGGTWRTDGPVIDQARTAIAKAEGRPNG